MLRFGGHGRKAAHLSLSLATAGSSSTAAAAGTGFRYIPIYGWVTASAVGSVAITNGTGGSALLTIKTQAGGLTPFDFWDEPGNLLANKTLNLESNTGIGVHDFHVWYVVERAGAGQNALVP